MTRWRIPFAGFLLALMGGISYAWGVFVIPLMDKFGWTNTEATLPFTIFMIVFSLSMVPGGRLQDTLGPRKVAAGGAVLFLLAYGLASLVGYLPSVWWLILTYGLLGGIACGLTYACVAPPARKWFPDKPGTAVSFAVMGFGLAALVFAPLKASYLIPVYGIEKTLIVIGVLTSVVSFFAAALLRNPPEGWEPAGWEADKAQKSIRMRQESLPKELLTNSLFWLMWLIFALVIAGGLIALGLIPAYGQRVIGLPPVEASLAISIFSGVNGLGRPLAGYLGDRYGVVWVLICTFILQSIAFFCFPLLATTSSMLYILSGLLGWGYAVILALYPSLTSICFGIKHLGVNYGLVFTAFGVGALAPLIGAWALDVTRSFTPIFVAAGVMAATGSILSGVMKTRHDLL